MKIGQNNMHISLNQGIGANHISRKSSFSSILSAETVNVPVQSGKIFSEHNKPDWFVVGGYEGESYYRLVNGEIFYYLDEEATKANMEDHTIYMQKIDVLTDKLSKLGINGKITAYSEELIPNNYKAFFIETDDPMQKNLFGFELENGDFLFGEVPNGIDAQNMMKMFNRFYAENTIDRVKSSTDELIRELISFFDSLNMGETRYLTKV